MAIQKTSKSEVIIRSVTLEGVKEIMFDRYAGDNNTRLEPWQKLYYEKPDSTVIGIPAINLMSFLSAHNTNSAPKRLRDARKYKAIANACLSFVDIEPNFIPLMKEGKPIKFGKFENDVDKTSGVYIHRAVARLEKGIPNPKERPVLPLPWSISFTLKLYPTREITEQDLINLFDEGGRAIGLGTWRGMFGKFIVKNWS